MTAVDDALGLAFEGRGTVDEGSSKEGEDHVGIGDRGGTAPAGDGGGEETGKPSGTMGHLTALEFGEIGRKVSERL